MKQIRPTVLLLNNISGKGLDLLSNKYVFGPDIVEPDGILVRSKEIKDIDLPKCLKAIARAGAGTNNIPIRDCTARGIIVFNTPGANANGVKELVILGMLLACRKVTEGIVWAKSLANEGDGVPDLIEKGKAKFGGTEICGKKLGVIGLGAIGKMVADAGYALGMEVYGFDPYLTSGPSRNTKYVELDVLLSECDFITLHVPLNDKTKNMINAEKFALMNKGVKLLNFSRAGLVNTTNLKQAIADEVVGCYVTDFPDADTIGLDNCIAIPHLGASTEESEENCAIMAVEQLKDFLENGNIKNSVNFPNCCLERCGKQRLIVINRNQPGVIEKITNILGKNGINIAEMLNKGKGDFAYNIIDVDEVIGDVIQEVVDLPEVVRVRVL